MAARAIVLHIFSRTPLNPAEALRIQAYSAASRLGLCHVGIATVPGKLKIKHTGFSNEALLRSGCNEPVDEGTTECASARAVFARSQYSTRLIQCRRVDISMQANSICLPTVDVFVAAICLLAKHAVRQHSNDSRKHLAA